jgi:hypothetical protein
MFRRPRPRYGSELTAPKRTTEHLREFKRRLTTPLNSRVRGFFLRIGSFLAVSPATRLNAPLVVVFEPEGLSLSLTFEIFVLP